MLSRNGAAIGCLDAPGTRGVLHSSANRAYGYAAWAPSKGSLEPYREVHSLWSILEEDTPLVARVTQNLLENHENSRSLKLRFYLAK